jgi:hypothetical protein
MLSGCEHDVNFTGKEPSPRMVVNSIIDAKSDTHTIQIAESVFIFSDQQSSVVENPEIELKINGVEIAFEDDYDSYSFYKFKASLNAGDKIEFSAYTPKHGTVSGYDIVPESTVEIKNIEHSWFWKNEMSYLRLFITIKDNPDERNYYRIRVLDYSQIVPRDPNPSWSLREVFIEDEILFNKPSEPEEGGSTPNFYRIFTDDLFQGQEYTLNVYVDLTNVAQSPWHTFVRQYIKVEIQTLSEKLYRNLRSKELASGTVGNLFAEPVKIYSNMRGGFGILGTYNSTEMVKLIGSKGN